MKKQNQSTLFNSRGMTLIEILIVLAIIGTLMAFLLPNITGNLEKSRVKQTKIGMSQLINALNLYNTDCNKYPDTLDQLLKPDPECGGEAYIKKPIKDAWGKDFIYTKTDGSYTLKSLGKDGRENGDGYNKDITSDDVN